MEEFSLPEPPQKQFDFVGGGSSGVVSFLPPDRVLKLGHKNFSPDDLIHERKIYEALGPHPRIVKYFGMWKDIERSAIFEYHPRGCARQVLLFGEKDQIDRHKWAVQTVEALIFIHSKGYVHGDLNTTNLLVTESDNIVLCDFAGSTLAGQRPHVLCVTSYIFRPREDSEEENIRSVIDDLFAFGSLLYELHTNHKPYSDKKEHEVEKLYRQHIFPDVAALPSGDIMMKCWMGKYKTAEEVLTDLQLASKSGTLYSRFLDIVRCFLSPLRRSLLLRLPWFRRFARP